LFERSERTVLHGLDRRTELALCWPLARFHFLKAPPMTHSDASSLAQSTPAPSYSPLSDREGSGAQSPADVEWSVAQRFAFRFLLVYVVLYTFPGPVNELPGTDFLSDPYASLWRVVVPWFGTHVLRLAQPVSIRPSGSGDKMFDWVFIAALLAIAFVAATVWTVVDRRHRSHAKLFAAFTLYLRLFLARTMFSYGFDKVIPNQFSPMDPARLTQFIGEASPGGFAWTFLGFSIAYEMFAGAAEVASASLLLFRRTQTLGALVGAGVLTNVLMLNMSFDIPVKQYSAHLLLMCVFLIALDRERLTNMFLRARATVPARHIDLFTTPRMRLGSWVAGVALGLWMVGGSLYGEIRGLHEFGRLSPRGPLYGIFEVEEVVKNGAMQPPLLTDATRWRRFATSSRRALVRLATDSSVSYGLRTDSVKHVATLMNGPDSTKWLRLAYAFSDSAHLALTGRIGADSVDIKLLRRPESSYLLRSRGFHWVNEVPFFR
jgi:hypothetical protein